MRRVRFQCGADVFRTGPAGTKRVAGLNRWGSIPPIQVSGPGRAGPDVRGAAVVPSVRRLPSGALTKQLSETEAVLRLCPASGGVFQPL